MKANAEIKGCYHDLFVIQEVTGKKKVTFLEFVLTCPHYSNQAPPNTQKAREQIKETRQELIPDLQIPLLIYLHALQTYLTIQLLAIITAVEL